MLLLAKLTKVVVKIYPDVHDFFQIQKLSHAITIYARQQLTTTPRARSMQFNVHVS